MKGTRASKSLAAVSLALATMVPAIQASASTVQFKTKTITIGNYSVNASGFVAKDSGTPTTYMPLWYVLHGLGHLGFATKWNGATKTLDITAPVWVTPKAAGNPGSGSASIYLNGVLVQRANLQVATDPASHVSSVYMPIYYVARVMNLVGISSAWDGTTWKLGLADATAPNPMYTTYQTSVGARGSKSLTWDITVRDFNGNLVTGKDVSDFTVSLNGRAPQPVSAYPFNGFRSVGPGEYQFNYQGEADDEADKATVSVDGVPVAEQALTWTASGQPVAEMSGMAKPAPGKAGSKLVTLTLKLIDANNTWASNLSASDITISIDGGTPLSVSAAPFSGFVVNSDGTCSVTYTSATDGETHHFDVYVNQAKILSNVEVHTPGAPGQVDWFNSEFVNGAPGLAGSHQVALEYQLKDADGNPITGKTASDFHVSINGGATTDMAGAPFSAFKDNGNGTYDVVFTGQTDNEHDVLDVTVDGQVVANRQDIYTANVAGEPDYWESSITHTVPGSIGSKAETFDFLLMDANGNPVNGKTASDFVVSINGGTKVTFTDGHFSHFKAMSNGVYQVTYTGALDDAYDTLDVTVDGIEVGGYASLPSGMPDGAVSGLNTASQDSGSGQTQLTFFINDSRKLGVTGLTAQNFAITVNGAPASLTGGAFSDFKALGGGVYTVMFKGDTQSDYQMNISVDGVSIAQQYDVFTP